MKKIVIGVDANEGNIPNRVGSNIFAFEIIKRFHSSKNSNINFNIYLKDKPINDWPEPKKNWQYRVLSPKLFWTQWRLPLELMINKKIDVFFTPGHYGPRFCSKPLVISIMDMAFIRFPQYFKRSDLYQLKNWTAYSVKQALHVLTISKFSKSEIVKFYNYPENNISVIYPGIEHIQIAREDNINEIKNKFKIKNKYFLYIGTLQPRKNLIRLIKAFAKLNALDRDYSLVIVGKKGWLYNEFFEKIKQFNLENEIVFTEFIKDSEKFTLLKNALAFILPSLYEGFGIPVLEAMLAKCPVIISHTSSLPEAGGEAALYIENPFSTEEIFKTMLKMIKFTQRERQYLIEKGLKQAGKFSWDKASANALSILQRIGGVYG